MQPGPRGTAPDGTRRTPTAGRRRRSGRGPTATRPTRDPPPSRGRGRSRRDARRTVLPAPAVDRAALRDGRQPRAGVGGDTRLWPLCERVGQCVLREILGAAEVTDHAGECRDDAGGLDPPHRRDGASRRLRWFRATLGRDVGHTVRPCGSRVPRASPLPSRSTRCPEGSPRGRSPGAPRAWFRVRAERAWPTRRPPPWTRPRGSRSR